MNGTVFSYNLDSSVAAIVKHVHLLGLQCPLNFLGAKFFFSNKKKTAIIFIFLITLC